MSNKYELIRSKETGCPICIFDNENQVRVCTFNSSNPAIETEAVKVLDGLSETATLHAQLERLTAPLPDAEEYAKHVIAHLYPDHSNGARLVQIALNEWLNRHLATLRRERDELRAELLTTHQMACRVGLERDELAKLLAGGAGRIARERHRHVTQEGYDAAHDDEHTFGTIRVVAAMLACQGTDASVSDPLDRDNWNLGRHPLERRLEIAGALLAAELDRLERDSARAKQGEAP